MSVGYASRCKRCSLFQSFLLSFPVSSRLVVYRGFVRTQSALFFSFSLSVLSNPWFAAVVFVLLFHRCIITRPSPCFPWEESFPTGARETLWAFRGATDNVVRQCACPKDSSY